MEKFLDSTLVKLQISIILKIMLSFADFRETQIILFYIHECDFFVARH